MKKIINGRLYDTETAKSIGYNSFGCPGDFSYCREELFRKRTCEFFLYCYGGPSSRYAERTGTNSWSIGWEIIPLSYDDALAWAEKNLDAGDYIRAFGEPTVDDTVPSSFRFSGAAAQKLSRLASASGLSKAAVLEKLIMDAPI